MGLDTIEVACAKVELDDEYPLLRSLIFAEPVAVPELDGRARRGGAVGIVEAGDVAGEGRTTSVHG